MVKLKLSGIGRKTAKEPLDVLASYVNDKEFCYATLNKVSRSFGAVINQLPEDLRDPVCLFYLVLRGLDSVEDDASFPKQEKLELLRSFYTKNLETSWHINGVGDSPDYRTLLANYEKVSRTFQHLDTPHQKIILDICKSMGDGMAEFVEKPVRSVEDYNLYCHYVAGLVGIGLSKLFAVSGVEHFSLSNQTKLSNSMGLFLQKTNIVRDYHEDLHLNRSFWPEEIWNQYASRLDDFEQAPNSEASLACLNHMVVDALEHSADSLRYLSLIENEKVFRFCAIPQAMAIATLAKLYNNPNVFTGVVKIRKGLAAMMMTDLDNYQTSAKYFNYFAQKLLNNLDPKDPNSERGRKYLLEVIGLCSSKPERPEVSNAKWESIKEDDYAVS